MGSPKHNGYQSRADAVTVAVRNAPLRCACSPARLKAAVPWEVFDGL
jgi:hypothetical protein